MKEQLKEKKFQRIDDSEILSLYRQGYSANIIAEKYSLNPAHISKVLRASGLGPRDYRTMPDFIKEILKSLILAGFTYAEISRKANIAYNYIREYVGSSQELREKSPELFRRKANNAVPPTVPEATVCSQRMVRKFWSDFVNGDGGFCILMKNMNADEEQIIYLFSVINDEMLDSHNARLRSYILLEKEKGIPVIGISRNLGVSPAYVSNVIKEASIEKNK